MINEKIFLKMPIPFKKGIEIFPPTVGDVVKDDLFFQKVNSFILTQEEIEDSLTEMGTKEVEYIPTPFEVFFHNYFGDELCKYMIDEGFKILFHSEALLLPEARVIIVDSIENISNTTDLTKLKLIKEEDFFELQNLVRQVLGMEIVESPIEDEDPRIKRMKMKARYRDKIKAKQNKEKGMTFFDCMVAICCMGIGITPLNFEEISYALVSNLIKAYQSKEKYDIDIKSMLAGAKDIHPEYWMSSWNKKE